MVQQASSCQALPWSRQKGLHNTARLFRVVQGVKVNMGSMGMSDYVASAWPAQGRPCFCAVSVIA